MARTLGPYELQKRIAVGGLAEIWLARKGGLLGFEQLYALKFLLPQHAQSAEQRSWMVDEARLTARLDHPNIIKVHDLAEADGTLYVAMEYVQGLDLSKLVARANEHGEHIPLEVAAFVAGEVCAALDYAHTRTDASGASLQIVHRDISPQNLLLGVGGEVKLIDFGVAMTASGGRMDTKTGIIKGKLQYMAPEYAVGARQDARSDLFSLGLCLYEMITGRSAYDSHNPAQLIAAVKNASFDAPRRQRPDLPPDLEQIVLTALRKDSDARFGSALEMQRALSSFVARHAPNFTKVELAAYIARMLEDPQPAKHSLRSGHATLDDDFADAQTMIGESPARPLAEPDDDPPTLVGARGSDKVVVEDSLEEDDALTEPLDAGTLQKARELLSLADLARAAGDDDSDERDIAVLQTMALEEEPAPKNARLDEDVETIAPDEGLRLSADDLARLPTSEVALGDFDDVADVPTATDLDVNAIREDRAAPQILTQSGFQRFLTADQIKEIREQSGAPTVQPRATVEAAIKDVPPQIAPPSGGWGAPGEAPQPPEASPQRNQVSSGEQTQRMASTTGERAAPELPNPAGQSGERPPVAKIEPTDWSNAVPQKKEDVRLGVKETAGGLAGKFSQRFEAYSKTEEGRRGNDALIVAVLALVFIGIIVWTMFIATS